MRELNWAQVPSYLIDEGEELLRHALREPDFNFLVIHGDNLGLTTNCLSKTISVALNWNDLSMMGLLVYVNARVFHPAGYAIARNPDTGVSNVVLFEDEPWEFPPDTYVESMNKMLALNMLVEGWNVPWSDN